MDQRTVKQVTVHRSSHYRFFKKTVFNKFAIFTGKHLCWSFFLINLQVFRLQRRCFPVNIVKFLENLFWRTYANGCFCIYILLKGLKHSLRERCPSTEFFPVRIWTLFTQWFRILRNDTTVVELIFLKLRSFTKIQYPSHLYSVIVHNISWKTGR